MHWEEESNVNDSNDALNLNIELNINTSPSKMSPRKKRKPSATTQMLEKELKAETDRRNSVNLANMVGENSNLTLMVASLRRQNEDLKVQKMIWNEQKFVMG